MKSRSAHLTTAARRFAFQLIRPHRLLHAGGAKIISTITILFLTLVLSTCKESLPVYQSPTQLFSGNLEPYYSLTPKENALHVYFRVRNIFDETLQGGGIFHGQIQLVSLRDPNITKTFSISKDNIIFARQYNSIAGILTIDPGDSLVFDVSWDLSKRPLLDDNSRDMTTAFFNIQPEPGCGQREKSVPEDFAVQGSIEILKQGSPVVGKQAIYRFCLVNQWINPRDCPPVGSPCNMIISSGD